MKHKVSFFAILLMALALPQSVRAYDFSAVAPSGQTLYYSIVNGQARVTYPGSSQTGYWGGYTKPTGALVIPSSVTYYGNTYSVTSIGDHAFSDCSGLTSVTIPNSVTDINGRAFQNCSGLTSVTIPNSVTSIGYAAFSGCSGLTSIAVASGNPAYDSRNNCNAIIETATNTLIAGCQNTVIPNSVTSIGAFAFDGCSGLTGTLTIPNSVTSIGYAAFYDCSGLSSINIPNTVTYIGDWAFGGTSSLTSITLPNTIDTIRTNTFVSSGLTSITIPASVVHIGERAFGWCYGLSLNIPNSVTSIGENAFRYVRHIEYHGTATYSSNNLYWGAFSMNGVTDGDFVYSDNTKTTLIHYIGSSAAVVIPSMVTTIGQYAFALHPTLTSVTIPNSVTFIGRYAFEGCSGLTSVTIPNSVRSIGDGSFSGCSGLTTVNFNADICTNMGTDYAFVFDGCTSLTTLNIGSNVKIIPNYAFSGCSGLTSVTIPNSVTSIGSKAFSGCSGLTGTLTIPNSVILIGIDAFGDCSGLTTVNFNADSCISTGNSNVFSGCTSLTTLNIGSNVKIIPNYAFSGCHGLTGTLTIPDSVNSIGDYAFSGCSGLTSLTIGNSVTSIGNKAFRYCSGLTSLTIGNSVNSIGDEAFFGCSGLTSIAVASGNPAYDSRNNCNAIIETASNTLIAGCQNTVIPNSVTSIGPYAFVFCRGLTSITIGNSVGRIYSNSFSGCTGITSVTFNARNCTIYNYNGDSPISGPVSALFGRNNITSFTFGDNVQRIPDYLCYGMTGLTSITIPNSVTQIGTKAFYNCTALATVVVGNGVSTLSDSTFANCNHMTNLTLGSGLQTIAPAAFAGCNAVLRMTVRASTPPTSTSNPFTAFNTGIPVYVPCNSVSAYQNAPYWGFFTNYQGNFYSFSVAAADPSMGYVNIITQPDCNNHQAHFQANAYNGFHFVRWSDGNTTNPRYLVVSSDVELTALFAPDAQPEFTVSVASADPTMGTVSGGGTYTQGSTATLTATPNSGYRFVRWHDNNTDNPRTVTVTADATYTAYFEAEVGIGDVAWEGIEVALQGSALTIHGATGEPVTITDLMGRCLYSARATESTHVALPSAGVYFVRVGDRPARKVVAARR